MKKVRLVKMTYKVVEKFVSINGEGQRAGQLAVFIRFAGCNLNCSYCDTLWANGKDVDYEELTAQEIYDYILAAKVTNVTLTGGEPLLEEGMLALLEVLAQDKALYIEIETNGSIGLEKFVHIDNRPSFTMDYKLPSSGMETSMLRDNFKHLTQKDTVKFVVGSILDLEKAKEVIEDFHLVSQTRVYISPVFGLIDVGSIVEFMKEYHMNGINLQIQLHKVIWDVSERGV